MRAIRLYLDTGRRTRLEDFRVPFNDREQPNAPGATIQAKSLQFVRRAGTHVWGWSPVAYRQFIYVLSGRVSVETTVGPGRGGDLAPGDVILAENTSGQGHRLTTHGDCQLLSVGVEDWKRDPNVAVLPPLPELWADHNYNYCNISRLYTGEDNRSHYKDIEGLFPDDKGTPGPIIPLGDATTLRFTRFADGWTTNWHPESARTLAIFHSGAFEMITGPGGVEIYTPGDVCMVEDTGKNAEGHMHGNYGDTRLTVIRGFPDSVLRGR